VVTQRLTGESIMKYAAILGMSATLWACGGGGAEPKSADEATVEQGSTAEGEATAEAPATAPTTFSEQVALGQSLYGEHCSKCHGASGEGAKAPAVVGLDKGALPLDPPAGAKYRTTQFKTVLDIAVFVTQNMPPNKAGTLTEEQYWSILAFDLKANGIDLGDKKLDAALATTLEVPRK
jgi:cytochrome c